MLTAPASYRNSQAQPSTFVERVHNYIDAQPAGGKSPLKFDAAFLERRLQAHREYQAQLTAELATGIILEVAIALEDVA